MKTEKINIVMVGTTHPGNIGAAARAMHNMCISNLVLVNPQCSIDELAYSRASGADVILDQIKHRDSLRQSIKDCSLVIATSARSRSLPWPDLSPRQMAQKIWSLNDQAEVALIFGPEHSGLSNEELALCHFNVTIPTNPNFSSLNVASAIQVLCYEIYQTAGNASHIKAAESNECIVTSEDLEGYFAHLEQVLVKTQFLDTEKPGLLMKRLRRLYQRIDLSKTEVNILRGILSSVEKYKS
ncbi:MAG: RNA methyltransferase [Proteobacteria bacterium]|nr:RNA methyltransferase [Pseudomonadota bacterium]